MAALPFNVTLNNLTAHPRQVTESVVFNDPGAPDANGNWENNVRDGRAVWSFVSNGGAVGASGALRIKRVGSNQVGYVVAFGHWNQNNQMWIGVAGDVLVGQTAAVVLPNFYGAGVWNADGQFWSQDNVFQIVHPGTLETITITVIPGAGALNAEVEIRG